MTDERFVELARLFRLTPLMEQQYICAYQIGYLVSQGRSRADQAYHHFCREDQRPLLVAIRVGSQEHVYANATIGGKTWTDGEAAEIVRTFKTYDAIFGRVDVKREPVSVVSAHFRRGMGELALAAVADHFRLGKKPGQNGDLHGRMR